MAKIYVSCGFQNSERGWGDWASQSLTSNGQQAVWFGQGGSPRAALEQAKAAVPTCRAMVAFVHHRGGGDMPPGVRDELLLAVNAGIPIIAFWDPQVTKVDGLLAQAVMYRVPFPRGEQEALQSMQNLIAWAKKLDHDAFVGALKGIGALVAGVWLLSKIAGPDSEDDEEEEEY